MTLAAQNISFAYPGAPTLFGHLTFTAEAGERVALCAPSGSGKTTLCRLLSGYLKPDSGQVLVDGQPLAGIRGPRPVQLLMQHPEQAFDPRMRMAASLTEAGDITEPRSQALQERFGLRDTWMSRLPHELSGGELMRFAFVRACMARPSYLIADEATAMLDAVTQAELWHALIELSQEEGMGIVMVSHSPALLARVATHTVSLASL